MSNKGKKENAFLNFIWLDKKRRVKNICFILSVFLVLIALAVGYINAKLDLMVTGDDPTVLNTQPSEKEEEEKIYIGNNLGTDDDPVDEAEMEKVVSQTGREYLYKWAHNEIQPMSDSNVINVLLIGLDSRSGLTNGGRSDTLILLSLNKTTKQINMTSFFRDTYCNIYGTETYNKINSSYARGGADCLINTLESNFKINIDYYVTVDFSTFEDIIDELGGLTVTVQEYEAAYIRKTEKISMPSGENVKLNGKQALLFARIRKCDSDSDVSRTRRQRMVITSLINSVKGASIGEINNMLDALLPYVRTNLTKSEIVSYAMKALTGGWLSYPIKETTISDSSVFKTGYVGRSSVVFIEFPVAAKRIQMAVYGTSNIPVEAENPPFFSLLRSF